MLRGKSSQAHVNFFLYVSQYKRIHHTASGLHHFRITHTTVIPFLIANLPDTFLPALAGPHARCSILQKFNNYYQFILCTRCYFLWLLLLFLFFSRWLLKRDSVFTIQMTHMVGKRGKQVTRDANLPMHFTFPTTSPYNLP